MVLTYDRKKILPEKKVQSIVWPAMFFSGFKLQPEKITTRKKRYSRLANGWNKSQITVCPVKIRNTNYYKTGKNYNRRKKRYSRLVVGWSTKHKTQHTQTQQPTRWAVPPYPPAALPSLSPWVEQWRHQIMALPLPDTMRRPQAIGVALAVIGLLAWGGKIRGIE